VEKGDQLVRFDAGDESSAGILLKHDLVGCGLAINLHQVKRAIRHNEFLHFSVRATESTILSLMRELRPCKLQVREKVVFPVVKEEVTAAHLPC
jgi:hypothetical protein